MLSRAERFEMIWFIISFWIFFGVPILLKNKYWFILISLCFHEIRNYVTTTTKKTQQPKKPVQFYSQNLNFIPACPDFLYKATTYNIPLQVIPFWYFFWLILITWGTFFSHFYVQFVMLQWWQIDLICYFIAYLGFSSLHVSNKIPPYGRSDEIRWW